MYLKWSSFIFPFLFYQLRVNDKTKIERKKRLFIFALQQMRISIDERRRKKMFFYLFLFFTGANNKKSISKEFLQNGYHSSP